MQYRTPHIVLAGLAAVTLAGCSDPVAPPAASPDALGHPVLARGSAKVTRTTSVVPFTIAGGTCGLTTTVTGTAEIQMVTHASQDKDGDWRVAFNWSAHGTASGADGSQYRFNYTANGKWVDPVDPTTLPVVIDFVDHFNLLGQGRTPDLRVFLHGQFVYPTFKTVGDPVIRGPDLFCDPI